MRQGYHRDPSNFPKITPFEAEMRRRIWLNIFQADILHSWQMGQPSMIRSCNCDTREPVNAFDEDFDVSSQSAPVSRPMETTITPISYQIAKSKLVSVLGKVMDRSHTLIHCTDKERLEVHENLVAVWENLPRHFRWLPLDRTLLSDSPTMIVERFYLSILYHRARCVLHRGAVIQAETQNAGFAFARLTCLESAMTLLDHQEDLIVNSRPGRRLEPMRWHIKNIASHDFLLAASLVYLELRHDRSHSSGEYCKQSKGYTTPDERQRMLEALKSSSEIWQELLHENQYAEKASAILPLMLYNLTRNEVQDGSPGMMATREKPISSSNWSQGPMSSNSSGNSATTQMLSERRQNASDAYGSDLSTMPFITDPTGDITSANIDWVSLHIQCRESSH